MTTWAQLTPGQQAYLDTLARAGGEWRRSPSILDASTLKDYIGLRDDLHLIETKLSEYTDFVLYDRVTAKGLLVWQQGQVASVPPRSVWVALCGDDIISVHATSESSRLICEEISGEKLEWETCDVYPDGTRRMVDRSYVYSVEEWRVLP